MAKFSNRVFGSNVDKTIIKVFDNLQKGSLDVEPLAESAPTHQDYIGDRTPFARMWSPALITGSADRKEVIYNVVNDNRDDSYVEANEPVGDLVFKELTDNRFLKPKAGITSISTKTEGALGALKNTTVEFMVHNKKDFDTIFLPFFLKPGATVVLDFGWSDKSFQPYEINGVIDNSDLFLNDFKLFIYGGVRKGPNNEVIRRNSNGDYFYYPNEDQTEGAVIYDNDPNVEGFINQNKGLVESVVGKVTDYNASLTPQGSYQCSVNLKSENSSLLDSEITEDNDLKFVFANQIEEIIIQTLTSGENQITNNDLIIYDRLNAKEKRQVRESFYTNIAITGSKALGEIPEKAVKSGLFYQNVLDDGGNEKNGQDILYIAYGLFEDLFLNGLISENKVDKFHTVNYNTTDTFVRYERHLVLRQKAQLGSSEELPLFLMPKEWSNTSNGENKEFTNQRNGLNLYNTPIIPFRDLFISVPLISKTFAQKQNVNDALDSILESINSDSYGVFRLKMKSTNDSFSSITFQDANLINVPLEKESELVFDITSGNSIVSNVDLKFEMPKGGLGSLIAIGEKGDYEFFDDDNTDNLNFLRILNKDYGEDVHLKSLPLIKPKSPDEKIDELVKTGGTVHDYSDKSSKNIVKRIEIDIPKNIKSNWVTSVKTIVADKQNVENKPPNTDKPLREFKSKGDGDSILPAGSVRDYYGKLAKLNTVLQSGENTVSPILPLSLSLTIYGNTYLNIGDFISINFLPTEYRDNVIFQIVNIEQKVDSNWQTTYETVMRLKPNKKKKVVDTKLKMPMLSTQYVTNFLNRKGNIGLFKNSAGEAISIPVDPVGMSAIRIDTYYNGDIENLNNTETEVIKGLATPDSRVIPLQFEKPKSHEDFCFIYAFQKTIAQYIFNDAGRGRVTMLNVVKEENTSLRFDLIPISQFDILFTALVEDAGDGTLGFFNEENGLIKFLEESTINSTSGNKVTAKGILQNTVKELAKETDLNNLYVKYLYGNEEDYQQAVRVDSDGDGKDDILSYEVVGTGEKISKIDKDYGFVIPSYAFMHTQDKYEGVKYTYGINVDFKGVSVCPILVFPGWFFMDTGVNDFCNRLLRNYNLLLKDTYKAFLREFVEQEQAQTTEPENPGYPFIQANYNAASFGSNASAFEARQKLAQKFGFDGYGDYRGAKSLDDRKADWDNSSDIW